MKKIHLAALATALATTGFAQTEMSSWTSTGRGVATSMATDYHSIGINPSNLGWTNLFEEKSFTFGFLEGAYSLHSEALTKQQIRENIMSSAEGEKLTYQQKVDAAKEFTDAGFAANVDMNWFGASMTTSGIGGFAFGVRERVNFFSLLSDDASDVLFLGYNAPYFDNKFTISGNDTIPTNNPDSVDYATASIPNPISEIMGDSKIGFTWLREYSFSWGFPIVKTDDMMIYSGVGLKYLQGLGMIDIQRTDNGFEAYSALTPGFGIDYGVDPADNPSSLEDTTGFKSVGSGFGFDIGFSLVMNQKLRIGLAVTDIGGVTWDGNVFQVNDTLVVEYENGGVDSYNIFSEIGDFAGESGLLAWNGVTQRKTKLPTRFRLGASYRFSDKFEAGIDIIAPMNEEPMNLQGVVFGAGADFRPIEVLRLSAGFMTGGNYDFKIPVGITFSVPSGAWEFGVASRDALTFFLNNSPTVSMAAGLLRFRF